jgi:hypothetical protein
VAHRQAEEVFVLEGDGLRNHVTYRVRASPIRATPRSISSGDTA